MIMNYLFLAIQQSPEDLNFGMMFLRMVLFLGLILILIYVVLKKVLPLLIRSQGLRSRTVKILERVPLDQRRSLLVVEVQEKVYLIGSAEGQINVLMELDRDKLASQVTTGQKASSFEDILKKTLLKSKSKESTE